MIWHGVAFIFHRLKVTLNGNTTDHTKCEKEVKHFSEAPVFQVPKKLAQENHRTDFVVGCSQGEESKSHAGNSVCLLEIEAFTYGVIPSVVPVIWASEIMVFLKNV